MNDDGRFSWEEVFVSNMIEARVGAEMSQTELARRIRAEGVPCHQQTVQRIEQRTRATRLNEAQAITAVLFNGQWDRAIGLRNADSLHQLLSSAVERLATGKRVEVDNFRGRLQDGFEGVQAARGFANRYEQACDAEGVAADPELLLRVEQVAADWMEFLQRFYGAGLLHSTTEVEGADGVDQEAP